MTLKSTRQSVAFALAQVEVVVFKAFYSDNKLAADIRYFARLLSSTPAAAWQSQEPAGPGWQVPLWKNEEPFHSMNTWRGVLLFSIIPRVVARLVNTRGQSWFEQTSLPPDESFDFRRVLGYKNALFVARYLDEEIFAWKSFGWNGAQYGAGLMN